MFLLSSKITRKILTVTLLLLLLLTQSPKNQVLAQEPSSSSEISEDISTPIHTALSIDRFPPAGQPAELVCEVSSVIDAPGTTAQIELPPDAQLLSGDLSWQGDLLPGNPVRFSATIIFDSVGDTAVFCRARRVIDAENSWGDLAALYLSIKQANSSLGFAPTPLDERDKLGEMSIPGEGQVINASAVQPGPSRQGQIFELPPGTDPVQPGGDTSFGANEDEIVPQGTLTITGHWYFYDRNDNLTSEQLIVEVVTGDSSAHLAWCYTGVDGYYSCGPFTNPGSVGVRSRLLSYTSFTPYGDVLVTVNPDWGTTGNQDNAFGTTTSVQVFTDGTHDIGSWNVINGASYERAYWITCDLISVWKYIWFGAGSSQNPQETAGPSTVEWKVDSTNGTYYEEGGNIHLTGEDPLSNTVVGHEYGHNIMYTIYGNWFPTTYCPSPHYVQLSSHANCAWTEGWANFLPLAVNNDPVYRWASGASLNLENPTWDTASWSNGDTVEGRVAGALWDILDTANENDDQYSDGSIVNIWDTTYHQNDNNFSEYWSAWKSRGHDNSSAGPVMGIYQSTIDYRNGPPNDDFANATNVSSLPYTVVNLGTANATTQGRDPVTSCGSTGTPKQSRSVWYRYTPTTSGIHAITTSGSNYDTVLAVWTGTFGLLTSQGCNDDSGGLQSSLTITLNSGTIYYIEVMQYGSGAGGQLALSVTVGGLPPVPTNVQASNGAYTDRVRVTWNTSSGATSYQVYRATSVSGTKTNLGSTANTTFDDTWATGGVTYYYWVTACNTSGCSNYSNHDSGWRSGPVGLPIDVYLLVDLTGSFYDDLPVFKAQAASVISSLTASNSNIRFGLGKFEDYPIYPFGEAAYGDKAYERKVDLTFDTNLVLNAINELSTQYGKGADGPESQLPALYQTATGTGQDLSGVGYPGASIPAGQQANFRSEATKLIILWTDAPFHQPGDPGNIPYPGPGFSQTVSAVKALSNAFVYGIYSGGDGLTTTANQQNVRSVEVSDISVESSSDLNAIVAATGAFAGDSGVDCNNDGVIDIPRGQPLVCGIGLSGQGIGNAIIALVEAERGPALVFLPFIIKN